jgi:hypothetical protein
MEHLLTILNRITACGTVSDFIELCELELCAVIGSIEANRWTADQRADFMMYYTLFRANTTAAFNIRDALRREQTENLTPELITELKKDLYELSSFESGIEPEELAATLDLYIQILSDADGGVEGVIASITGNYFKTFFLTLHSLDINKRIKIGQDSNPNRFRLVQLL